MFLYWAGMKLPTPAWVTCDLTDLCHIPIGCCFFRSKSPDLVVFYREFTPWFDQSCVPYLNFLQFYYILSGRGEPEWCTVLKVQGDPDDLLERVPSKSDPSYCHMPS